MLKEKNWYVAKIFILDTVQLEYFIPLVTAVEKFVENHGRDG